MESLGASRVGSDTCRHAFLSHLGEANLPEVHTISRVLMRGAGRWNH